MKNVKLLFLLIASVIFITGCSAETTDTGDEIENNNKSKKVTDSSPKQGGEIRIAYSAQPPVLDPNMTIAVATSDIMRNVFETLITVDSEYNIKPMLADSWEHSEDGRKITFHLREGIQFHNGEELLAEDVVASMEKWKRDPGSKNQLPLDSKFVAEDDYTVALHLTEPISTILVSLAHLGSGFPAIMPKEIVDRSPETGVEEYIGTGPFQFVEWKQDQYIHLKKFKDYQPRAEVADGLSGKREALVDDLYFEFVLDSSTRIAGIQSGEYDIAHAVPFDNVEQLEKDSNIDITITYGGMLSIFPNKRVGIFKDVKAREALISALNMEEIMIGAYSGERFYTLNHNMMPTHQEAQWYSDEGKEKYNQNNPDKAKKLLEEIGYDGEEVTIITTRDYEDQYNGSVVVQEQLEKIGMNVNLEVYDWATVLDRSKDENEFDLFIMGYVGPPQPTASSYIDKGYAGWPDSPEIENIKEQISRQPTLEDAKSLYDDLQKAYWDYIPVVKIGEYNRVFATRNWVQNFQWQDGLITWNLSKAQ